MNRNQSGSELFGTAVMKSEEYVMMAEVMVENGYSVEQAALEIAALDDMLHMQRMRLVIIKNARTQKGFMRSDATLRDFMNRRLDVLVEELKQVNP
ncbi:hypothetical protein UFOVP350_31 [uncultured Caudovirales phage]|uniref:Uncharacterized protein n=1 Tax=uncultured Caudovirales phage TaxID=2100421 RepID=A0A6J5M0W5_9CAUD|nr:hypothetical protein UFOVP350_31 [uncultured Caudovirales phage]